MELVVGYVVQVVEASIHDDHVDVLGEVSRR